MLLLHRDKNTNVTNEKFSHYTVWENRDDGKESNAVCWFVWHHMRPPLLLYSHAKPYKFRMYRVTCGVHRCQSCTSQLHTTHSLVTGSSRRRRLRCDEKFSIFCAKPSRANRERFPSISSSCTYEKRRR